MTLICYSACKDKKDFGNKWHTLPIIQKKVVILHTTKLIRTIVMTQRNNAFDFLCGLCVLRMGLNHITSFCGFSSAAWWQTLFYWTFFFISFFFFKAGYFNKSVQGATMPYIQKKARQLLVPYLIWGLIGCVVYFSMMSIAAIRFHHFIEDVSIEHLWEAGGFWGNPPMWFLLVFFASYVGMHLLSKVPHLHWLVCLFPFISYGLWRMDNPLWWSLNGVFMSIYVFMLGHYWHRLIQWLSNKAGFCLSLVLVLLFVAGNLMAHGELVAGNNLWSGHPVAVVVNLSTALCGLSGMLLTVHMPRIPIINFIGQHSMVFFVAHYPMIVFYRFIRITFGHSLLGRWDDLIILCVIIPVACSWLVPYVERIPWLSGRFRTPAVKDGNA